MCDEDVKKVEAKVHVLGESAGKRIACVVSEVGEHVEECIHRALDLKRKTVVLRLDDELLEAVDKLVDSGLFKGRSEASLFLMSAGLKAQGKLFEEIDAKIEKIRRIREEMKKVGEKLSGRRETEKENGQ